MQTTQNETAILAGTQEPLMDLEQLQPGALLVGATMRHIWSVDAVNGAEITLQKLPISVINGHIHQFTTIGKGRSCLCGLRQQDAKDFLPASAGKPRVHVISVSSRELSIPQKYEIYAYLRSNGEVKIVTATEGPQPVGNHDDSTLQWSQDLPILPVLHKVWSLPDALKAFIL